MQLPTGLGRLLVVAGAALIAIILFVNTSSLCGLVAAFGILLLAVWYAEQGGITTFVSTTDRGVFITGCDTGFGFELAHQLDAQGLHVFAGCLFKDGEGGKMLRENCSERLRVVQLDVTNDQQVKDALQYVKDNLPKLGLWAVVNNAGLNLIGETELTTMKQYKKVIDINLVGAIRITKTFMPLIIKTKGRIVNVTSVKGLITPVFDAAYTATKFGLEGFSDCLRLEMRKWGVTVAIIEPGCFGSGTKAVNADRMAKDFAEMWDGMDDEMRQRYGKEYVDSFNSMITSSDRVSCFDISPVIDAMTDAVLSTQPKIRYIVGGGNQWIDPYKYYIYLSWFLPYSVMDYLIHRWSASTFPLPKALQN